MRIGTGVIAGSLIAASIAGASLSAPSRGTKVKVAPGAPIEIGKLPRPTEAMQSTPVGVSALTADECKEIGGEVKVDSAGICSGLFYCSTTDNRGKVREVCLESGK